MQRLVTALAIFLSLTGAATAQEIKLEPPKMEDMVKLETYEVGKDIPEIMLSSEDKGLAYLSENKGKLIILNLWATWCPPCLFELPSLNALQVAMGSDKFKVITVSVEQGEEGLKSAKKYMTDHKFDQLTPYIDANNEVQKLEVLKGINGIPVTLIIDPNMKVVARYQGDADWNGRAARAVIEYYLKNTSYNPYVNVMDNRLY